ncbi:MAG: low temperature requirement protein A [Anaerolineaceae bacterium]|nr:low temperature requirement protein A [Anaerolineaceae bacterium]
MHETEMRVRWVVPMLPRSPDETHRGATPLELLFDLTMVIAVASAATGLHHGIIEGHITETLIHYLMVFFGVLWLWMGFSWFASSYDNDDIPYRLLVFMQMTGALIVASGVERIFANEDLSITVLGYVVIRIAYVIQWLRVARSDIEHRTTALRYGLGAAACQIAWVALLFLPKETHLPLFVFLVIVELIIPVWAEQASVTTFHVHHIRERYGLFSLIVLGETILSTSVAFQTATDESGMTASLLPLAIGGLLIVYSIWWLYFYRHTPLRMDSLISTFLWSYGHFGVFAATAAVGAGLAIAVDMVSHHGEISQTTGNLALTIPTAIYVLSLWILQEHPRGKNIVNMLLHPICAVLIVLTSFTNQTVILTGVILVILVVVRFIRRLE